MDSIREETTVEDIVETIRMYMSDDIQNEKCFILLEGSDDVDLLEELVEENVCCVESVCGKHGLHRLLTNSLLCAKEIIAVRDRDYAETSSFPDRMFAYDHCCMETMILSNELIANKFYKIFDIQWGNEEDYVIKGMRELAPLSLLRRKNEWENLGYDFKKCGFGNIFSEDGTIEIKKCFEKLQCPEYLYAECVEEADIIEDELLFDITNGHDLCSFIAHYGKMGKRTMSEKEIRKILIFGYGKDSFKTSCLYETLCEYQRQHNIMIVS